MKIITLLLIMSILGCSKSSPSDAIANNIEKKISDLESKVAKLEQHNEITSLISKIESVAFLKVGETAFQTLKSPIGTLTFAIEDIKPFANGSKVKLSIGNPHNADLVGVSFKIDYGELDENKTPNQNSQKTKEISLSGEIKGGYWNHKEIILDGLSEEKLGFIRIYELEAKSITLLMKR